MNALQTFAEVYERGGVRRAARALGVTHSSVSRHLAELEAWMGVPLVQRGAGRRGLSFTTQGEALGKAVAGGFRDIARVVDSVRESRSEASVLVGAPASFAARWLLPRLPDFEAAHPRIEVSVIVGHRLEDLERAGAEVSIRMGSRVAPTAHCEVLMDDELYPVMSRSYWEKVGRPEESDDLLRLRLLHDRDPNASWESWRREFGPATLDVGKGPRFTSTDLVLRAAGQGQGVALARHQLAQADIAAGLLYRPIARRSVKVASSYWLVFSSHFAPRGATLVVAHWLKREAARRPDALSAM